MTWRALWPADLGVQGGAALLLLWLSVMLCDSVLSFKARSFARAFKHERLQAVQGALLGALSVNSFLMGMWLLWIVRALTLALVCTALFALSLALWGAWLPALAMCLYVAALFYAVSAFKFQVLKEPLVWSDLMLLKEIMLCPRFYLGYVKPLYLVAGALGFCALVGSELLLSLYTCHFATSGGRTSACFLFMLAVALLFAVLSAMSSLQKQAAARTCADECLKGAVLGIMLNFLLGLAVKLSRACWPQTLKAQASAMQQLHAHPTKAANLVLVQAESLLSLKRLQGKGLSDDYLSFAAGSAHQHGLLQLAYVGAYTMRAEFAAITGIDHKDLGAYASDPYLLAQKRLDIAALPKLLATQGYHCIAVHFNAGRFFNRRTIFKRFGFAEFISTDNLPDRYRRLMKTQGADAALGAYVAARLQQAQSSGDKLFIFAITLSGHGPYVGHSALEQAQCYATRLKNFNAGMQTLLAALSERDRLLVYGDHVPPLAQLLSLGTAHTLQPEVFAFNFTTAELQDAGWLAYGASHAGTQAADCTYQQQNQVSATPDLGALEAVQLNTLMLRAGGLYA